MSTSTQTETTPKAGFSASHLVIFFGLMLGAMGQTVLFAVLGPVAREIGLTEVQTGVIISVSALTVVLMSPVWGRISDTRGRKPVFVISVLGFAVASAGFAVLLNAGLSGWMMGMTALIVLIVARILYALVVSGGQPAAGGFIADTSTAENRSGAMAMIGGAFGIGSILGPAAAFVFAPFGVLAPLFVIAGLGVLCAIAALLIMKEPERRPESDTADVALSAFDGRIFRVLLGVVLLFVGFSMVQQTMAFYVQDVGGLSATEASARTGLVIGAVALANLVAFAVVAMRKPPTGMLLMAGSAFMALGVALLLSEPGLMRMIAAAIGMGLGFGAFLPGAQTRASLAVSEDQQGIAAGYVSSAMAGGFIVGPLLGTSLYMVAPFWTYSVSAVLALVGGLVAVMRSNS